ncbi:MAG: EAL domain-containing protein [Actinobacteria bacterium]|nr:EAL domain-containing protein [Actinomycetota bacterium]
MTTSAASVDGAAATVFDFLTPLRVGAGPGDTDVETFRGLLDAIPLPMWVFDLETLAFLEVNDAALAHYGWSRAEFLTRTARDIRPAEDVPLLEADVARVRDAPRDRSEGWRHISRDGTVIDVEITTSPVTFNGRAARLVLAHDVSEQRQLTRALESSDAQLQEAQAITQVGSWEVDLVSGKLQWSAQLYRMLDIAPDTEPTRDLVFGVVHADDRPLLDAVFDAIDAGEDGAGCDLRMLVDGDARWFHSRWRILRENERAIRAVGTSQDITDRKHDEARLAHQALHDPLTGLPNRTLFTDRLSRALERLEHSPGVVAVLFIDLDRLKPVNDGLGHQAGDQVLIETATRLRDLVRYGDTVARFGGDEFAVLCEELPSIEKATEVAGRILAALGQPVAIDGRRVAVSASIGISGTEDHAATPDIVLREADAAMYHAKELGRDRYEVFDQEARARSAARVQRAAELQRALDRSELRVLYQPDVDLVNEAGVGVEALVRWEHPDLGLIGPLEFISVAEDTGLIIPLGAWVLRTACAEVAAWETPPGAEPLSLSVNLSARQLANPDLAATVADALRDSGLQPGRLCLEITESVLMEDVESAIGALHVLKELGVRLAIDDFGTGYSSLSYLRRFPVDIVKIDRSFVSELGFDPAADAIVAAIVNLSHALGLSVVGEGVEEEEQLVALRALRADRAQGFYWSRPVTPDALREWQRRPRDVALEPTIVELRPLLADRVEALRSTAGRKAVLQAPGNLASAYADAGAIKTVLDHLLGNALAYSGDDRPIVVSATADRRWVRVSVADYGIGMTPDESKRCFEQFWQADLPGGNRRRGTGIGLYVVRSLVESMGGEVSVKSAKGKGTTFTFAVPRSAKAATRGNSLVPTWARTPPSESSCDRSASPPGERHDCTGRPDQHRPRPRLHRLRRDDGHRDAARRPHLRLLPLRVGVDLHGVHVRPAPLRPRPARGHRGPSRRRPRPVRGGRRAPGGRAVAVPAHRGVRRRPGRPLRVRHAAVAGRPADRVRRVPRRDGAGHRPGGRRAAPRRRHGGGQPDPRADLHGDRLVHPADAARQPAGDGRLVGVRHLPVGDLPDVRLDARGVGRLCGQRPLRARHPRLRHRLAVDSRRAVLPLGGAQPVPRVAARLERRSRRRRQRPRSVGEGGLELWSGAYGSILVDADKCR